MMKLRNWWFNFSTHILYDRRNVEFHKIMFNSFMSTCPYSLFLLLFEVLNRVMIQVWNPREVILKTLVHWSRISPQFASLRSSRHVLERSKFHFSLEEKFEVWSWNLFDESDWEVEVGSCKMQCAKWKLEKIWSWLEVNVEVFQPVWILLPLTFHLRLWLVVFERFKFHFPLEVGRFNMKNLKWEVGCKTFL